MSASPERRLTSYFYIRRFVRTDEYAIIGSLCYAFSGFATYNIFFNHFHEAMVFFPLLLIGVEELVQNRRRGVFALAVAVNCIVNYWFFTVSYTHLDVYKRQPRWTHTAGNPWYCNCPAGSHSRCHRR